MTDLPPRKRGIAMVFQSYAVFPHLTVFDNIAFGLRMQKRPDDEIRRRVEQRGGDCCSSSRISAAIRPSCPAGSASASPWRARL